MNVWSRLNKGSTGGPDQSKMSMWKDENKISADSEEEKRSADFSMDSTPLEPAGKKTGRQGVVKWVLFLLFIIYVLISYYRVPILTTIGSYLIVEHPLKKADIIVCLAGRPVERGLVTAALYEKGLAPRVFVSREIIPDGNEVLKSRGIHYPETRDLLLMILKGLGVPRSACHTSESIARSTIEEAKIVRKYVKKKGYRSLIVVTSPTHTRRAWLSYRRVFRKDKVELRMAPSKYSNFRPNNWWKTRRYIKEVIIEYQKLLYYYVKYL